MEKKERTSEKDLQALLQHISTLAHLHLSEEEKKEFSTQFSQILAYVETLQTLSLTDIPPTSHPFVTEQKVRPDKEEEFHDKEKIIQSAPEGKGPFFTVPRFLKGEK